MSVVTRFATPLPPAAAPAVAILERLRGAGFQALLAGGCVRDLLLGRAPHDYDVATAARPDEVCGLFRSTRKVGAQFGVVLVRSQRIWVEVATFRRDAAYLDGRRPTHVTFADAEADAQRRDFTINGMFLDPAEPAVIDHVGGRDDLSAGLIRAIGDPAARFAEDHLRLVRAVRFAARFGFALEARTRAAIVEHAGKLAAIAAERRRDELEKILTHPNRAGAFALLAACDLLPPLWGEAEWSADRIATCERELAALPDEADFEVSMAVLLGGHPAKRINAICRTLSCSNQQRETIRWLVAERDTLAGIDTLPLPRLKRLAVQPAFGDLRNLLAARHAGSDALLARLDERLAAIDPDQLAPPPLVRGEDLAERGVAPGPDYRVLLDALYTRQLNEEFADRDAAFAALDAAIRERGN